MERKIKTIIDSFIKNPLPAMLDNLDEAFLSLLLEKEAYLIKYKKDNYISKIEKIIDRYHDYRNFIYAQMKKGKKFPPAFLMNKIYPSVSRLILLLTHKCQLRCKYCRVGKFPASMNKDIALKAVDVLFTSNSQDLELQFFGGEPLLEFDLLKEVVAYAQNLNKKKKKNLIFILTTNGIALTRDKIDFIKNHRFLVEYSIDGSLENQLFTRKTVSGKNYYRRIMDNFNYLRQADIPHYSISVFMPENVSRAFESFVHLAGTGFEHLQVNYSLGVFWPEQAIKTFFEQTRRIANYSKNNKAEFINFSSIRKEPVVLNAELTVDYDGGVYLESGICLEEDFSEMKKKFLVGDIFTIKNINLYGTTWFQNLYRLSKVYAEKNPRFRRIIVNNISLGRKYADFLKKLRKSNGIFVEQHGSICKNYVKSF